MKKNPLNVAQGSTSSKATTSLPFRETQSCMGIGYVVYPPKRLYKTIFHLFIHWDEGCIITQNFPLGQELGTHYFITPFRIETWVSNPVILSRKFLNFSFIKTIVKHEMQWELFHRIFFLGGRWGLVEKVKNLGCNKLKLINFKI